MKPPPDPGRPLAFWGLDPDAEVMVDPGGKADVNARTVVVVTVAVVLVAAQVGVVAFVVGFGPFAPDASGSESGATPEAPGSGGGSGGSGTPGGDGGATGSSEPPPYDLDVLGTEPCGNTCRDVTVRLTNNRNATAEALTVRTRIYAGNTTDEDARVWEGQNDVGTLEAGASTTATARVSLSYFEAASVQRRGGWVTVVTTVESEAMTRSFEERWKVT
ncbi:MAG: hypothetical protein V5A62_03350 [Haloarculaceae archaeon]